jgi:hypothetical protein
LDERVGHLAGSRPRGGQVFAGRGADRREVARAVGIASLLVLLDVPAAQRGAQDRLLVGLVQYGLDLAGLLDAGHPGWPAHGGAGSGRKWAIMFAGLALGDARLARPNAAWPSARFGEDMQTAFTRDLPYGPTAWNGATAVYGGHQGVWAARAVSSDPSWGPYEHLPPARWPTYASSPRYIGETYRRCCTSLSWVGEALAARLLHAEAAWQHDAFFAYVDRWMTRGSDSTDVAAIRAATGEDFGAAWQAQGQTWDAFVQALWTRYR